MVSSKKGVAPTMENSVDFFNFCTMENRMPIYEIIMERFTRQFRVSISNSLRMITDLSYSHKTMHFRDWVQKAEKPSCMTILKLKSLGGPAVVKANGALSYGVIDSLLGGTGKQADLKGKEFTSLELSLMKDLSMMMLDDLEEAFSPVHRVDAEFLRMEINPQFIGIVPPDSKVVVTTFKVEFENVEGKFELVIPYSTLFPIRDKLFVSHKK